MNGPGRGSRWFVLFSLLMTLMIALGVLARPARAWVFDADTDRIDDRIERVHDVGIRASYENEDVNRRRTIAVFEGTPLRYGVYVGYDHHPESADLSALRALGLGVMKPYLYIDYVRAEADFEQISRIAGLPGVTRIESIPMIYTENHWGSRTVRARDSRGLKKSQNYVLFPSAGQDLGLNGTGVVVAVLDTGVNDAPDAINPGYPGHEGLLGKFLGGGNFFLGDPLFNTALTASENPSDHGGEASSYHATHVAGTIMGTGGADGVFTGVAPAARLVDCKVLSDAGAGFGSTDGIEWCIYNKTNSWGLTGADTIYAGIDVLSMSLGGTSSSDGTDANAQMVNAAVDAGLVVCIATGNDSSQDYIASPASADNSISVGATSHGNSLDRSDDTVTDFSNEGPRLDDGDGDHLDEMKPSVVAPGDAIFSADGDFLSDGGGYKMLSGTSMATPCVSGVCALLLQANPNLAPMQIRSILQNTAEHGIPSVKGARSNDPFGLDQNYNPGCGWGLVDAYAAALEATNSASGAQVAQFRPVYSGGVVDVRWITQREYSFLGFNVYRALDTGGTPGSFAKINGPVPVSPSPEGDSVLEGDDNRTPYVYVDADPALVPGQTYWYQARWVDGGGQEHPVPAAPVDFGERPRVATLFYSIVHNEPDHDLQIHVGASRTQNAHDAEYSTLGGGVADQDSVFIIEPANAGTATTGYLEHFWSLGLSEEDAVGALLPPNFDHAWFVNVAEGGYVNRLGRITSFSMFVNDSTGSASGTTYVTNSTLPRPTVETQEVAVWIPEATALTVEEARLAAVEDAGGVRILFTPSRPLPLASLRLARGESPELHGSTILPLPARLLAGGAFEFVDRDVAPGKTYWYWVLSSRTGDQGSASTIVSGPVQGRPSGTDLSRTGLRVAGANPMRESGRLQFIVGRDAAAGGKAPVSLVVHDVQGRTVRSLATGERATGEYSLEWDGRDAEGRLVPQGSYYIRFAAGNVHSSSKVVVIR